MFSGNFGGPLSKRASFFVDVDRRMIDENSVVNYTGLDASLNPVTVNNFVISPNRRTSISSFAAEFFIWSCVDGYVLIFGGPGAYESNRSGKQTIEARFCARISQWVLRLVPLSNTILASTTRTSLRCPSRNEPGASTAMPPFGWR